MAFFNTKIHFQCQNHIFQVKKITKFTPPKKNCVICDDNLPCHLHISSLPTPPSCGHVFQRGDVEIPFMNVLHPFDDV
jgi:hypothetical protein